VRAVPTGSVDDRRWARCRTDWDRRTIETVSYALLNFFFCRLESALGLKDATEAELDARLEEYLRSHRGSSELSL
jgi:hypothetical protein